MLGNFLLFLLVLPPLYPAGFLFQILVQAVRCPESASRHPCLMGRAWPSQIPAPPAFSHATCSGHLHAQAG